MKTIVEQLNVTDFPFEIKDSKGKVIYFEDYRRYWWKREYNSNGKEIYFEDSKRYWWKREYNSNGKEIYFEDSIGFWFKREFDSKDKQIHFEDSKGFWAKREWDSNGKEIYYEDSNGIKIIDNRPKVELKEQIKIIENEVDPYYVLIEVTPDCGGGICDSEIELAISQNIELLEKYCMKQHKYIPLTKHTPNKDYKLFPCAVWYYIRETKKIIIN